MCSVLASSLPDLYLSRFCFGFRLRDKKCADTHYLAYYFRSGEGREIMEPLAQGAIPYNLSKTALLRTKVPLPPRPEQCAIATILRDMDAEISALEQKLAKARALKQGVMQALLTGRIRLV